MKRDFMELRDEDVKAIVKSKKRGDFEKRYIIKLESVKELYDKLEANKNVLPYMLGITKRLKDIG